MRHINARITLILTLVFASLLVSLPVQQGNAAEYYIYRDPTGRLVISNQKPPLGSQIIRQRDFPEANGSQVQQTNANNEAQSNGGMEGPPKSSNSK
jgi:hypothetical protein